MKWQKRIAIAAATCSLLGTLIWFVLGRRAFPIADVDEAELETEVEA